MIIPVDYIDKHGTHQPLEYFISRLAFIKHLAIAGQGLASRLNKIIREWGMLLHYSFYLQKNAFYSNHFSEPPDILYDPTEKGQFSNLAGKAIADFLSKRISHSILTINYEAEMRIRGIFIKGPRPDLLAYSRKSMFAIEAKGYTKGPGNMIAHKNQAQKGPIKGINFSIASVSYNIYNSIKCNYHDPYSDDIGFDNEALRKSSQRYYSILTAFLNEKYFDINKRIYGQEEFYEIGLSLNKIKKIFERDLHFMPFQLLENIEIHRPKIILPLKIREFSENGISGELKPFKFIQEDGLYIDSDRIGLSVR